MTGVPNMTVIRTEKTSNFTCLSADIFFDENLSDTAMVLLAQMLTVRAETWNLNINGLCKLVKRGIKAVKKALAELERYGYLFKHQVKDEKTKQFGHNQYLFYESPSLNPHFGKSAQDEHHFFEPEPSERKPSGGQASQSNTKPFNTKESIMDSQSVPEAEKTDGLSAEKEKSSEFSEDTKQSLAIFYDTQRVLKDMTDFQNLPHDDFREFTEQAIRYISEILSSGSAEPDKIIGQVKAIHSAEKSLIPFMQKMMKYCKKAVKNLKYPKARDSYLKKVILGFLTKYTPASDENKNFSREISVQPETAMPFGQMLLEMHHPDVNQNNYQNFPFDTQEHFIEYYGTDCYDWKKNDCYIPESFITSQPTMLNALNFLFSSCFKDNFDEDFDFFSRECVSYIAEAVCTGKRSYKQYTSPSVILSRINNLNMGFCGSGCSLYTFMKSFKSHLKEKLECYSVESNYKGYVTTMLLSYLCNEYLAKVRVKSTEFEIFYGSNYDED
ncbi:MAG: hypothetical protein IJJ69_10640 [Oscillospiraceae bacterium]|nr:hypothetical protein [Oscillospiraceae bacterium]